MLGDEQRHEVEAYINVIGSRPSSCSVSACTSLVFKAFIIHDLHHENLHSYSFDGGFLRGSQLS